MGDKLLFSEQSYDGFVGPKAHNFRAAVAKLSSDIIISNTDDDIVQAIMEEHAFAVPVLPENRDEQDQIYIAQLDTVSPPETTYTYHVPFTGDPMLFRVKPPEFAYSSVMLRGSVEGSEVLFSYKFSYYTRKGQDEEAHIAKERAELQQRFQHDIGQVRKYLASLSKQTQDLYKGWEMYIRETLRVSRNKLQRDQERNKDLGYVVRQRPDAKTFSPPVERKKAFSRLKHSIPTADLDLARYREIVSTLGHDG